MCVCVKFEHIKLMHSQTSETVEAIVAQLMEKQRNARQNALVKQLDQNCAESSCANGKHSFNTATRNNIHSKSYNDMLKRSDSVEHVSNATFNAFDAKVSDIENLSTYLFTKFIDNNIFCLIYCEFSLLFNYNTNKKFSNRIT